MTDWVKIGLGCGLLNYPEGDGQIFRIDSYADVYTVRQFAHNLTAEFDEELKWAKTEAGQANAMVSALQEKNERLRGLIKEAITIARRAHYGNMYLEIQSLADGIGFLEDNLEEPGK